MGKAPTAGPNSVDASPLSIVRTKGAPEDSGSRGEAETKSPVPKLSNWAMILLGFGGLGFAAYRSRRRPISIV